MERKIVHVIGTGTIGEPLIGLLCDYQHQLGIDEITFHKNSQKVILQNLYFNTMGVKMRSLLNFKKTHL